MISRIKFYELFFFLGAITLLLSGIFLSSAACTGVGLFLIYYGRQRLNTSSDTYNNSLKSRKINLFWNLIFLGISSIMVFSLINNILNIFFHDGVFLWNQYIIPLSVIGAIYYEILFRLSLNKKSRAASIILLILFITSVGAYILGGIWMKTDILMGFLYLTLTVIITFRRVYLELIEILS